MPKYLVQASYTAEGLKGLLKEGGSSRKAHIEQVVAGMGGTVDSFYYAFGDSDVVGVVDMPDHASVTALSLAIGATGTVQLKTTVLLTPEEVDAAVNKTVAYRPPGQ